MHLIQIYTHTHPYIHNIIIQFLNFPFFSCFFFVLLINFNSIFLIKKQKLFLFLRILLTLFGIFFFKLLFCCSLLEIYFILFYFSSFPQIQKKKCVVFTLSDGIWDLEPLLNRFFIKFY